MHCKHQRHPLLSSKDRSLVTPSTARKWKPYRLPSGAVFQQSLGPGIGTWRIRTAPVAKRRGTWLRGGTNLYCSKRSLVGTSSTEVAPQACSKASQPRGRLITRGGCCCYYCYYYYYYYYYYSPYSYGLLLLQFLVY